MTTGFTAFLIFGQALWTSDLVLGERELLVDLVVTPGDPGLSAPGAGSSKDPFKLLTAAALADILARCASNIDRGRKSTSEDLRFARSDWAEKTESLLLVLMRSPPFLPERSLRSVPPRARPTSVRAWRARLYACDASSAKALLVPIHIMLKAANAILSRVALVYVESMRRTNGVSMTQSAKKPMHHSTYLSSNVRSAERAR